MAEIASLIRGRSTPQRALVLVDSTNSDLPAISYALGDSWTVVATGDPGSWERVSGAADARARYFHELIEFER